MNQNKIVITGGPGTGKTAIIDELEAKGYYCFPEIIRLMTLEAKENGSLTSTSSNPISSVSDPMGFNTKILKGRVAQYRKSLDINISPIFFDRGIPDVLAYMDYFQQSYEMEFIEACKNHRYSKVFLLPPWREIYISDNERFESFEEAKDIHFHLERTYTKIGYTPIMVPTGSVENRIRFILKQIEKN